ncbi:MAG: hypothetical protein ACP6IP_01435 [Candidatus Njordarchaeia archaeon]
MVKVSLIGFCPNICGLFRFLIKCKDSGVVSPLMHFLGLSFNELDVNFLGLFSDVDELASYGASGDCLNGFLSSFSVERFSLSAFLGQSPDLTGDVSVVCLDSLDPKLAFDVLSKGLEMGYNFIVLGYNKEILKHFLKTFERSGKILAVGDLFGYFDDVAFSVLLTDYMRVLEIDYKYFDVFRGYNFGYYSGGFFGKFANRLNVVSVRRNIRESFVHSNAITEFVFGDHKYSLGLSFIGNEAISVGAKLFDLILIIHRFNQMGYSGFPNVLKKFAFLNYEVQDVLYWDAIRDLFNSFKEDNHG